MLHYLYFGTVYIFFILLKNIKFKGRVISKAANGAFFCLNPRCVSVKNYKAVQSRDKTSALAIAVSGFSYMLFNEPLPVFNPYTSQSNGEFFSKITALDSGDAALANG